MSAYAWDAPVKSIAECDGEHTAEVTGVTATDKNRASACTDLNAPDRATPGRIVEEWRRQHVAISTQLDAVVEDLARLADAGVRTPTFVALRRTSGGFAVLRDALHALTEVASDEDFDATSPAVKYVDCAFWWVSQLFGALADALDESAGNDEVDARIAGVLEFSTLYALAHVSPLHDDCDRIASPELRRACARVAADASWLTWQLKDIIDG